MSLVSLGLGIMKIRTGAEKSVAITREIQRKVSLLSGQASVTPSGQRAAHPTLLSPSQHGYC